MSTNAHFRLLLFAPFILCGLTVAACGDEVTGTSSQQRPLRSWEAGAIDPFGCPFIDPMPWVSMEEHQKACGPGCTPDGVNGTFVACIGDDVPLYPYEVFPQVVVCLTHPVDGEDYRFSSMETAWPLTYLCWPLCGADSILPGEDFQPPEECFEE